MQYLQAQTSNSFMWTKDDNERFVKSGGYSMIRNRNRKYSSSLIGTNKIWRVTEDWYWSCKYRQLYHWSKHLILQRGKSIVHHADHFRPNSTTYLRWRIFDPNTSEEFMTSIYFAIIIETFFTLTIDSGAAFTFYTKTLFSFVYSTCYCRCTCVNCK